MSECILIRYVSKKNLQNNKKYNKIHKYMFNKNKINKCMNYFIYIIKIIKFNNVMFIKLFSLLFLQQTEDKNKLKQITHIYFYFTFLIKKFFS